MSAPFAVCVIAAVMLAACSSAPTTPNRLSGFQDNTRSGMSPNATNYIRINIDKEKGSVNSLLDGNYYTRIRGHWAAQTLLNDSGTRDVAIDSPDYDKDQRNILARLLVGKNRSFTFLANIGVESRLKYKTTIPLYSISHVSDGTGESFDVNLKDIWYSPFIRVTADTSITTEVTAKRTQEVKTGAVSAAIKVAQVAVEQLAPGAKVLTALNQEQIKKEAKVWDAAIGQLFGQSAAETRGGDGIVKTWLNGQTAIVSLLAPTDSDSLMPGYFLGSWYFRMDEPRRSLFSADPCLIKTSIDVACAAAVQQAVTATAILNEPVAANISLVASLRQKDWYGVMTKALVENGSGASTFCRQLIQAVDELGLSSVDARLALWALTAGEPLAKAAVAQIVNDADCKAVLKPFTFAVPTI